MAEIIEKRHARIKFGSKGKRKVGCNGCVPQTRYRHFALRTFIQLNKASVCPEDFFSITRVSLLQLVQSSTSKLLFAFMSGARGLDTLEAVN